MNVQLRNLLVLFLLAFPAAQARADDYADTINVFRKAGESGQFFGKSYGYAVLPTVGKGGFVVGGAHGKGRVYVRGAYVGDTSRGRLGASGHHRAIGKRERHPAPRQECRPVLQGHGGFHGRQRRSDVRGQHRRAEIHLRPEEIGAVHLQGP